MILVFGKNGQVATALSELLPDGIFLDRNQCDFLKPRQVLHHLDKIKPHIVINTSAYTAVDMAEEEKDTALQLNATTPGVIANWCYENNAYLIHYSTDYVFSGDGSAPWTENSVPNPVNWYGQTKMEGDKNILASKSNAYIFRVSWVHSPWGNNFPKKILQLASTQDELRIINDQWGSPTDARDIAKVTKNLVDLLKSGKPAPEKGVYHLSSETYITWYDFALMIISNAKKQGAQLKTTKVVPISSEEFITSAKRPKNSRLGSIHEIDIFKL